MTSYNAKVSHNIEQIKQDIEKAGSQDELVEVIKQVASHPGPLDYQDNLYRIFCGLSLSLALVSLVLNFFGFELPDALVSVMGMYMESSVFWYPIIGFITLGYWLEDKGWKLPLSGPVWGRLAIWGGLAVLLLFLPMWPHLYWDKWLYTLSVWLGFYSPLMGLAVHNLVIGTLLLLWLRKRSNWRKPLSDRIFLLDALYNNNLKPVSFSGESLAEGFAERFVEFKRGNEKREIQQLFEGQYQGQEHSFDYQLYKYHYVVKTTQTETDSDGNTRTRTVRKSYYRHGIMLDFPFARALCLSSDVEVRPRGEKYTSASNAFNRRFKVRARDPIVAARLLSPVLEERLTQFAEAFRNLVLEICPNGKLCVAVDADLLGVKRVYGLDKPQAFAEEIAGHTELKEIAHILDTVHEMMRYSDNNFKASA